MATAIAQRRDPQIKEYTYLWEGVDRNNRSVRGETKGASEAVVSSNLRRQGIRITKLRRETFRGGGRVTERDITFFTRQLSTMLRAGVPLLQAFEIVARGHRNPRFSRLMMDIKGRVEAGSSLSQAFREHPGQFDALYCNLVGAGEASGALDTILDRLATYKEKILAIKSKIKSALFYPISVMVVAIVVVWVIMVWVIPSFKQVFANFGANLPAPTLMVIAISDFFVAYWWLMAGIIVATIIALFSLHRRSAPFRYAIDRLTLKLPIIGGIVEKATNARWTRTLATMFAAGVPLVESLDAVGGASGKFGLRRRHEEDPDRRQHRYEPHECDEQYRSLPDDGAADGADRRGVGLARQHAVQGCRLFRARGRRCRRGIVEPA
jgi:type IV pilus assembly protein PilC